MKFRVHVYAVVRVPVWIEAQTQPEAVQRVNDTFCLTDHISLPEDRDIAEVFDGEEVLSFMVDEEGDTEFKNSRNYEIVDGLAQEKKG